MAASDEDGKDEDDDDHEKKDAQKNKSLYLIPIIRTKTEITTSSTRVTDVIAKVVCSYV